MKLVDLDEVMFVPVVDETHGGVTVEMQMTVGEFFAKCCDGFEPEVVEAIPVEWLLKKKASCIRMSSRSSPNALLIGELIKAWRKEQEART